MTTTYCPSPALPVTSAPIDEGRLPSFRLRHLTARVLRQVARLWGAGSATPTSQALDAVDVASFHR